jgi:hypothetical protein
LPHSWPSVRGPSSIQHHLNTSGPVRQRACLDRQCRFGRSAALLRRPRRPLHSPGGAGDRTSATTPPVSLAEVKQRRCPGGCVLAGPGTRRRPQAFGLVGGARSISRLPGRRAAPFPKRSRHERGDRTSAFPRRQSSAADRLARVQWRRLACLPNAGRASALPTRRRSPVRSPSGHAPGDTRRGRSRHGEERRRHGAYELSEANRTPAAVAESARFSSRAALLAQTRASSRQRGTV